jgi:hypothetical protein
VLVNGVPKPKLSSDSVVKPRQYWQPVASLWSCRKPKQFNGLHMSEKTRVRLGRSVMKLIDYDDVKVISPEVLKARGRKALNRCKDMLKPLRPMAANPEFPKRWLSERMPKCVECLRKNLFTVGDKKKPSTWKRCGKSAEVHSSHNRLSGAGGGDKQIAVVALRTREGDLGQKILLEWLQANL